MTAGAAVRGPGHSGTLVDALHKLALFGVSILVVLLLMRGVSGGTASPTPPKWSKCVEHDATFKLGDLGGSLGAGSNTYILRSSKAAGMGNPRIPGQLLAMRVWEGNTTPVPGFSPGTKVVQIVFSRGGNADYEALWLPLDTTLKFGEAMFEQRGFAEGSFQWFLKQGNLRGMVQVLPRVSDLMRTKAYQYPGFNPNHYYTIPREADEGALLRSQGFPSFCP